PKATPPAARRDFRVPLVLALSTLGIVAAGLTLLRRASASTNGVALAASAKGVSAVAARGARFRERRNYVGTLQPWLAAKVGPQLVSAYVSTVLVRPGMTVRAGDVVATLDCRNSSAANDAVLSQARAAEARQRALASETARFQNLLDGGFVSPNEVEQRVAQTAAETAQLEALRAQSVGKRLEVNDCILRAPFDGEVATRAADPGSYVRPGTAIVSIVDRHLLRLVGDVPETDFEAVAPKTPVHFRLLSNGLELQGAVSRRAPAADDTTRTVRFEVDIEPQKRDLPVGTSAQIELEVGEAADAVEIPLTSARVRGKSATLFVVDGNTARKREVKVLGERGGSLFVTGEVAPGNLVVTEGRGLLANGDAVIVKDVSKEKPGAEAAP
ncbi:MAG TPA: efflux RND transporter periplasmic adaptor subunit, partial [Polyangiaceae bacterium]|nr:efflux RND transporter periplasmic adaptor subunit [Polyangiaceae bacterium]